MTPLFGRLAIGKLAVGFLAVGALTIPLRAADVPARWENLCRVAGGRQLNVTTSDGKTVSGTCSATPGDELVLTVNQKAVNIARSTLARIEMYDPGNGHHLADLGNGMSKSFRQGFGWLFSPAAPLGLITIPATVAWGAVAAPFCLLGDMGDNGPVKQEIKLTN
jgi:hypothetical protein